MQVSLEHLDFPPMFIILPKSYIIFFYPCIYLQDYTCSSVASKMVQLFIQFVNEWMWRNGGMINERKRRSARRRAWLNVVVFDYVSFSLIIWGWNNRLIIWGRGTNSLIQILQTIWPINDSVRFTKVDTLITFIPLPYQYFQWRNVPLENKN